MKPQFKHDCENCLFIGIFHDFDVYICLGTEAGSMIARYGDDGPQYASCNVKLIHHIINQPVAYVKAWRQAIQKLQPLNQLLQLGDTFQEIVGVSNEQLMS